jgi:hypothetical protein
MTVQMETRPWCSIVTTPPLEAERAKDIVHAVRYRHQKDVKDTLSGFKMVSTSLYTNVVPSFSNLWWDCEYHSARPDTTFNTVFNAADEERVAHCLRRFVEAEGAWANCSIKLCAEDPALPEASFHIATVCSVAFWAYPGVQRVLVKGSDGKLAFVDDIPRRSVSLSAGRKTHVVPSDPDSMKIELDWGKIELGRVLRGTKLGAMLDLRGDRPAFAREMGEGWHFDNVGHLYGFPDRAMQVELFEDLRRTHRDYFSKVSLGLTTKGEEGKAPVERCSRRGLVVGEERDVKALREELGGWGLRWNVSLYASVVPGFKIGSLAHPGWTPLLKWSSWYSKGIRERRLISWGCAVNQDERGVRVEISSDLRDEQRVLREAMKLGDADWRVLRPAEAS